MIDIYNDWTPLKKFAYPFWLVYGIMIIYNIIQGDSMSDIFLQIIVGVITTFITAIILWYLAFKKLPEKIKEDISSQITNEIQSQDEGKIPSQHKKLKENLSNEHSNLSNEHSSLSNENKQLLEYAKIVHEANLERKGINIANDRILENLDNVKATFENKEKENQKLFSDYISLKEMYNQQVLINKDFKQELENIKRDNSQLKIDNNTLKSELNAKITQTLKLSKELDLANEKIKGLSSKRRSNEISR